MLMYKWWNSVNSQQNIFVYNKDLILKKCNWLFFWFFLVIVCIWATQCMKGQSLQLPFIFGSWYSTYIKAAFQMVLFISMFMNVPHPHSVHRDPGGSSATLRMSSLQNLGASFPEHCSTEPLSWARTGMSQGTKPRGLGLSSWKGASAGYWLQGRTCWPLEVAHTPWKAADLLLHCKGMNSPTMLLGNAKGSSILGR